jgi:hypothetical protein
MKKAYTSFLHLLLAVVVLVSGMSFTVKKMVCLSSGNVEVGLYTLEDCCSDEQDASFEDVRIDSRCCDFSSQVFTLDKEAMLKGSSLKKADIDLVQFPRTNAFRLSAQVRQPPRFTFANLPPPLSGRQLLSFINMLNI